MINSEFEKQLTDRGFFFETPTLFVPSANLTAEYYSAETIMDILSHCQSPMGNFMPMVRKRGEQANTMSYYMKDEMGFEYFKIVCPVAQTEGEKMGITVPDWAKTVFWHVTKGFLLGAAFVVAKNPLELTSWLDIKTLLLAVLTGGLYGMAVEVLNYLNGFAPKTTAAKKGAATTTLRDKLSF